MSVPTNNGPNDPDNNPRWKPPKPKKKAAKKSTAPVRVGVGPRDPENDPRKYHNYGPAGDTGDYVGSSYFPGFKLGQTDPSGKALKPDDYRAWMAGNQSSPWFQAMRSTYGDKFVAYYWYATRVEMDDVNFSNQLALRFPGSDQLSAGGGGGGGGYGGGGGGGGVSKEQQFAAAEAAIRNRTETYGMPMSDADIKAIARVVINDNWSGDQLTDYLLGNTAGITKPGTFQATGDQIKALAASQLVTVSDATANEWSKRILSGELDIATVQSIFANQATTEFGWAAEAIKAGATMRDTLMPARDVLARELEMNANMIDFMDPQYRDLAQVTNTDGTKRAATLTEVQRAARKHSSWANTNNAASLASSVATMMRKVFEG